MLRFRIPLRIWAAFMLPLLATVLALYFLWRRAPVAPPELALLPFVAIVVFAMLMALFVSELRVSANGLQLNRVNRLVWADVAEARLKTFCGLPHLYVVRQRGLAWWIPLYYTGPSDIKEAILHYAPAHNPIARALA